jgi:hypothetical protein
MPINNYKEIIDFRNPSLVQIIPGLQSEMLII